MSHRFPSRSPGHAGLLFAVGLPVTAILIELVTGMCAGAFFDPLPTFGHLLLVALVPVANLLLWLLAREDEARGARWLALLAGAAVAVAFTYTLLLLPLLPISAIAILFFGIGLLPFAPLVALLLAGRWMAHIRWERRSGRFVVAGAAAGILLTGLADAPSTAVQLAVDRYAGSDDDRAGAVALMRAVGSRDLLLRAAYGDGARATGLVGAFAASWSGGMWSRGPDRSADARELYYRVTGEPFNARSKPVTGLAARADWFTFDSDLGGEAVGAPVEGLSLASSRIDGSTAAADNLSYVEWTVEVANAAVVQNEARFTLAMPEGAVASRATLWVNGEPREASVAGRAAARAAYQSVVSIRRDPLLVTTDGAGRLLVQAFPIAPHGTMRLRIGYTAPFVVAADGTRSQALPAIVERNFGIAPDLRHRVWLDGDAPLRTSDAAFAASGLVLRGALSDSDLLTRRPNFAAPRLTRATTRTGTAAAAAADGQPALTVEQRIAPAADPATALMILLDGSAPMAKTGVALSAALDALPAGLPVGLAVATDTPRIIAPAPWSPAQRTRIVAALEGVAYRGGQDNQAALAEAVALLHRPGGRLLWVHGAQPIDFARSRSAVEQVLARSTTVPGLIRYQAVPGRATTIQGEPLFETARMVTPGVDPIRDLRAILSAVAGAGWQTRYRLLTTAGPAGSSNIVRLWAGRELAATGRTSGAERDAQIALARRLNVVTPVSGAVVLETDEDYRRNNLPVPSADDVPTIPEPETWALLAILAAVAAWLWRHRGSPRAPRMIAA